MRYLDEPANSGHTVGPINVNEVDNAMAETQMSPNMILPHKV